MRFFVFLASLFLFSGCSFELSEHDPKAVFKDAEIYENSERVVEAIRNRDIETFKKLAHPEFLEMENYEEAFRNFLSFLPKDELQIRHFYSELRRGQGEYDGLPIYLTGYDVSGSNNQFRQLLIAIAPENGECCVTTYWNLRTTDILPSKYYDFSFEKKGWLHFLVFGLLVGVPLFISVTFISWFRQERDQRKKRWAIFILFGLWGIQFNWATGDLRNTLISQSDVGVTINFIKFHFLGAGFSKTFGPAYPYYPWIIQIGTPVGAIAYWVKRIWMSSRTRT